MLFFSSAANYIPEDVLLDIESKLQSTLDKLYIEYDVNYHMNQAVQNLQEQCDKVESKLTYDAMEN